MDERIEELERLLSVLKASTIVTLAGRGGAYIVIEDRIQELKDEY